MQKYAQLHTLWLEPATPQCRELITSRTGKLTSVTTATIEELKQRCLDMHCAPARVTQLFAHWSNNLHKYLADNHPLLTDQKDKPVDHTKPTSL